MTSIWKATKGFIAGGCFKNILSGERVKDIDIFFESESDFQEAVNLFNDEKHQKEGPSRGTWSSPVASRAPATSTSETWFGR